MNKKYVPLDTDDVGKKKMYELKTWKQNNLDDDENCDDLTNNSNRKSGKPKDFSAEEKCCNPFSTKLSRKPTIHTTKKMEILEREKNALLRCQLAKTTPILNNITQSIKYGNGKSISVGSLQMDNANKPKYASQSPSHLFPNVPSPNLLKIMTPKLGVFLNEKTQSKRRENINALGFNPREKQAEVDGQSGSFKIYKYGEQLYAKYNDSKMEISSNSTEHETNQQSEKNFEKRNIHKHITLKNSKLNIFPSTKSKRMSSMTAISLGYPVGIQLGSFNITSDYFPKDLQNKQSLDVLLVAHGMTHIKAPARWSAGDIDQILYTGTDLYKATKEENIHRLEPLSKGFCIKKHFLQVTVSEPIIVGKILTISDRAVDLKTGLFNFFNNYSCGILKTPNLEIYIKKDIAFYIFDPRGRTMDCYRNDNVGEAAIIVLSKLENVYHLILNMSQIDIKAPYKISNVEVSQKMDRKNAPEDFQVTIGGNKKIRSKDFQMIDDSKAVLKGSIHFGNNVFGKAASKQHLTATIMAVIYSKIDPPNSWSSPIIDRVLHFGTQFYLDCLDDGVIKNIRLPDIPSKLYIEDKYKCEIMIVPFMKQVCCEKMTFIFDNLLYIALNELLMTSSFKALLLQIDNYTYSIWQSNTSQTYFLFDGFAKDIDGNIDYYNGTATLIMTKNLNSLCETVVNRLLKLSYSKDAMVCIHGIKVLKLNKLTLNESKCKPTIKNAQLNNITKTNPDDVSKYPDAPSFIDSVEAVLTREQQNQMKEKCFEKPLYKQITNLNSPSLVAETIIDYEEIMATMQQELVCNDFVVNKSGDKCVEKVPSETILLVKQITSEIFKKLIAKKNAKCSKESVIASKKLNCNPCSDEKKCPEMTYIGMAEKILLTSDLTYLKQQKSDIMNNRIVIEETCDKTSTLIQPVPITLSEEKLIESNFEDLPDHSQIVRGTQNLYQIPLPPQLFNYENFSILNAIAVIITSAKYSIASWTTETIDYVLATALMLSDSIHLQNRMDFYIIPEHILPDIHFNEKHFNLKMNAFANGTWINLETELMKTLEFFNRFIIITSRGSLAILKRKNFYYFFEYAPCNIVGFIMQKDVPGVSCFMRFDDLHAMVRRIQANHSDINDDQKFLICHLMLKESEEAQSNIPYASYTQSQEKMIFDKFKEIKSARRKAREDSLKAIQEQIKAEKERLKKFYNLNNCIDKVNDDDSDKEDELNVNCLENSDYSFDVDVYRKTEDEEQDGEENDNLDNIDQFTDPPFYLDNLNVTALDKFEGYQKGEDGICRIKGTFGLTDRMVNENNDLRACHFASIFAILYLIKFPLQTMNYRNVDVILENGITTLKTLQSNESDYKRYKAHKHLKHVNFDNVNFELSINEFQNHFRICSNDQQIVQLLVSYFKMQKYLLFQFPNCCFLLVKENDKSFHMFDAYDEDDKDKRNKGKTDIIDTEEDIRDSEEFQEEDVLPSKDMLAHWRNFENLIDVVNYVLERVPSEQSKQFQLLTVTILSFKEMKHKRPTTGFFMLKTSQSLNGVEKKACLFQDDIENETINWTCEKQTLPWSRLLECNSMKIDRKMEKAKWKDFNIEIDNRLYSLWGNIHPNLKSFGINAGKQHIACCVTASVMSYIYNIDEWNATILDSIVIDGNNYFNESVKHLKCANYQMKYEDLAKFCIISNFKFAIEVKSVLYGQLYDMNDKRFNLRRALDYFFIAKNNRCGILQCGQRCLTIFNFNNKDYFMYDCQSYGMPLFSSNQGTTYVLKCCCLKILLQCLVMTMNVQCHNKQFNLYSVKMKLDSILPQSFVCNNINPYDGTIIQSSKEVLTEEIEESTTPVPRPKQMVSFLPLDSTVPVLLLDSTEPTPLLDSTEPYPLLDPPTPVPLLDTTVPVTILETTVPVLLPESTPPFTPLDATVLVPTPELPQVVTTEEPVLVVPVSEPTMSTRFTMEEPTITQGISVPPIPPPPPIAPRVSTIVDTSEEPTVPVPPPTPSTPRKKSG
ncbi:unnamed protein product [Diamesa serratosioi]